MRGLIVAVALTVLAVAPLAVAQTPITMERVVAPLAYTPGQTLTVTITLTKNDTRTVSALGVRETIPTDWSFGAVDSSIGAPPPVVQAKPGSIEFAYLTPPAFPVTFSYTLVTGALDKGQTTITGQAIYRFSGGELQSPVVGTQVSSSAAAEGEGEVEGEPGPDTGCLQCAKAQANKFGLPVGDLFVSVLAVLTLAGVARQHG